MIILDPSLHQKGTSDVNLGDRVIKDSINDFLSPKMQLEWVSYAHSITNTSPFFIGGANVLGPPQITLNSIWRPKFSNMIMRKLSGISFGAGWWSYEVEPNFFYAKLMKRYLSKIHPHSVRDEFTSYMLKKAGILNVYVTGCPTMYGHKDINCRTTADRTAIVTFTSYRPDIYRDLIWLRLLHEKFDKYFIFIQGAHDEEYARKLFGMLGYNFNHRLIKKYEELLALITSNKNLIHIGTRLHANMLFLRNALPSICLDVDSRTSEIKKTFAFLPIYSLYDFCDQILKNDYSYIVPKEFDDNFNKYINHLLMSLEEV